MALNWQSPVVPTGVQFNPGDTSFTNLLFNFLIPLEASTANQRDTVTLVPQASNPSILNPTIGVGFDLRAGGSIVQNAVFIGLGFAASVVNGTAAATPGSPAAQEYDYLAQIKADIALGTRSALSDMNAVMASRYANYKSNANYQTFIQDNAQAPIRSLFAFLTDNEVYGVFQTLWTNYYEPNILKQYPFLASDPASQTSREMEVIASLYWNGGKGLLGSSLSAAIASGNRAEAWYQIRYGSNKSKLPALATRRFYEAQTFGLFAVAGEPTLQESLQAYQMLTQHRATIFAYEVQYGTDPDSTANSNGLVPGGQDAAANRIYGLTGQSQVQTLAALLGTAATGYSSAEQLIITSLQAEAPSILSSLSTSFARPTDIFITSATTPIANAKSGDSISTAGILESGANHILVGTGGGQSLTGGFGNDVLVAEAGNETLVSGIGVDTIVAVGGSDQISLRGASATIDFEFQNLAGLTETINAGSSSSGAVDIGGAQVSGSTATPVASINMATNSNILTWSGSGGYTYSYDKGSGVLTISGGALVSASGANTIVIKKFNLSAAENGGFLGIQLQKSCTLTCAANTGVDPPPPAFDAGSTQSYTFSTDAPMDTAQTITLTLSGVNPADFQAIVDNQTVQQNSDGTFSFLLPAGQTNVSFSLTNTADVGSSGSLVLTAALSDPGNPNAGAATSNSVTQNFVEPTDDPFNTPQPSLYYDGQDTTSGSSGISYGDYSNQPGGTPVTAAGSGNSYISVVAVPNGANQLVGVANDSIDGGSGNDTIDAFFGDAGSDGGVNVINGHGGQDVIFSGYEEGDATVPGASAVRIYANSGVDLATAIANANLASATHEQGDLIVESNSNSTIVGGTGNDLLIDASGDAGGVIVAGSGDDTILGSDVVTNAPNSLAGSGYDDAGFTWSASFANNQLSLGGDIVFASQGLGEYTSGQAAALPSGYEGNVDQYGGALGNADDTIFGGAGNDVIILSNGDNEVQLGVGNATVLGGMGDDTIMGGGGNNSIIGGGGSDYIEDGSGNSELVGRGGDNTLIGGSGNDTLFAGGDGSNWATSETGDNYVDGGTGNALIYGAGGSDTLIAGEGNSSIFGGAGNEYIVGGDGNGQLVGGNGNDTIDAQGTTGTDLIQAGSGNTTIYGGDGSDHIQGTSGTDVIYAGDGGTAAAATEVDAGSGSTTVYGGDGIDSIFGGSGTDVLYAGDGGTDANPTLVKAGTGATTIYGGAGGDDLVDLSGGADSIVAGSGDAYMVGSGSDTLVAGSGTDYLTGTGNLTDVFSSTSGNALIDDTSGTITLEFTPDVSITDLSISADLDANNTPELIIQGDGGAITVDGGLAPNFVQSIVFDGSQTLSLTQLMQQADASGSTDPAVTAGTNGNLIFDTSEGDSVSAGTGSDTISAWGDSDTLTAGSAGTLIYAEGDDNVVYGGSGNDTLDALGTGTTLHGGTGNELFEVNDPTDVVVGSGTGSDTILSSVSYTLPTAVDTLTLTGSANLTAHGNFDAANLITGNAGNDTLVAGSGADSLVSGSGIDTLEGGSGKDTFVVNNSADEIDLIPYGSGTVDTSVSYVLRAPIYTMNLTGSANITATDDFGYATITGNAGDDTLIGGYGNDELIAGTGVDTFVAGSGHTTFVLNNAADVIEGLSSSDQDTVESSASFSLASGADTLIFTGTGNVSGAGNDDTSNSITGNTGNDTLAAGSGTDSLYAGSGVDTLIAGAGSDSLFGNAGDTYVLNSGFGNVVINQASGTGTLQFGAGITAADLQLSFTTGSDGNPALLIQDGSSAVTVDGGLNGSIGSFDFADGSDLSLGELAAEATVIPSTIASGTSNIVFDGAAGDSIDGGIGNDTIYALGANDTLVAGSGNQQLYGFGANDLLIGSTGDDGLHGGSGNDTLVAGPGNSVLYGGSATDSYVLTEGGTSTLVPSSVAGQAQIIYLPEGMTLSDFTSYPDAAGDLILQSLSGDTTAIVKGFYDGGSANKPWLITGDSDAPQFLGHWAGTQQETGSTFAQEIAGLQQAYAAQLKVTLNQLGEDGRLLFEGGYSNGTPGGPSRPPYYFYQFNGVTEQSVTVGGGSYSAEATESDQIQTTYYTQQATQTISTPIYGTVTTPEQIAFVPVGDTPTDQLNDENNNVQTVTENGQLGELVDIPGEIYTSITGYRTTTETIEEDTSTVNLTRNFNVTNITGDGGNDVITANPQYVGSVNTGDGNVFVNLGGFYDTEIGHSTYENNASNPDNLPPPGAFIEAGSGNDTLIGTGGEDQIAAGTGFDYMEGGLGTTYYVPMIGDSTAVIGDPATPYGEGPFAPTTLVLPNGITPSNLTYRLFQDAATGSEVLQLRNGSSSVLVYFTANPSNLGGGASAPNGVDSFQFADGTVLTRAQLLAQATLLPNDFDPLVSVDTQNLTAGETVSANGFFSATDSSDDPITWYRVTNSGEGGAYFTLDGKTQETGQPFYVSAGQLSQLSYVAGAADSTDSIQVSAFDGAIWSTSQTLMISPTGSSANTFSATGTDQLVTGATTAPDTLMGGYAGDTLVGGSGDDTFLYASGSGAETISESAPTSSSSNNTLQFGSGITPLMVTLAVTNGALDLQIGTNGDSIQIAGFNPTDPLNSVAIQNFSFSNGTSLSLSQLLAQAPAGSGTINYSDGSYTNYSIDPTGTQQYTAETITGPGDPLSQYTLNSDGSTEADTWTWAPDGSFVYTEISTPGDTWAGTKLVQDYNAEHQAVSQVITQSDGTIDTFAWTYATDGSITQTEVTTPGDGSPSSETIQNYNASGQLVTQQQDNADGSTDANTYSYGSDGSIVVTDVHTPAGGGASNTVTQDFNPQGQIVGQQNLNTDGSTDATVWTYNSDGSYSESDVHTPVSGAGEPTTTVQTYNSDNQFTGQNGYAPQSDGSYTDVWYKTDGSQGMYWWNASTLEYQESWQNVDGSTFTDDYQYAAGGSPGSTNVSFTETYSDSNGDEGTRVYNASTGVTTVTWDSPQTGSITGTTTNDSGFIGLQLQGELTNTTNDPSYFNPATSPVFTAFLAAHG